MERKSPLPKILRARRWRLPGLCCSCWQVYAGPLMRLELGLKENAKIIQINNCCLFFMNYRMMILNIWELTTDFTTWKIPEFKLLGRTDLLKKWNIGQVLSSCIQWPLKVNCPEEEREKDGLDVFREMTQCRRPLMIWTNIWWFIESNVRSAWIVPSYYHVET